MGIDILSLYVLPNAVPMTGIAPLLMKSIQQLAPLVSAQLMKNGMRRIRAKFLQNISNSFPFRLDNQMKMRGHDHKSKQNDRFLILEPNEAIKNDLDVFGFSQQMSPARD